MFKARRRQRKPIKMTFGRCVYAEGVRIGMYLSGILALVGILFTVILFKSDAVLFVRTGESGGFDLSVVNTSQRIFVLLSHVIIAFFAGITCDTIWTSYGDGYPIPDSIGDTLMGVGRAGTILVMLMVLAVMECATYLGFHIAATVGGFVLMLIVKIAILFIIGRVINRTIEL